MIIYKVTNKVNGKIYIGKTIQSLHDRWSRHVNDAMTNRLDTHFARAIRKYSQENFIAEVIDTADSKEELSEKEKYWIERYQSYSNGYNETIGGDGGNTYIGKNDSEMSLIKEKIRVTKLGSLNPMARPIKMLNIKTNQELHFGSAAEARDYFGETNHNFVTRRCQHKAKYLYRGEWNIAYEEEPYPSDYRTDKSIRKSREIRVLDLETGEEKEFVSYASAERYFGVANKRFSGKAYKQKTNTFVIDDRYKITVLD